jgi:hypothetical protein
MGYKLQQTGWWVTRSNEDRCWGLELGWEKKLERKFEFLLILI